MNAIQTVCHIPQAPRFIFDGYEVERVVLGCLVLYDDLWCDDITPAMFRLERHQVTYRAMQNLRRRNVGRDVVSIARELKRHAYYSPQSIEHDLKDLMDSVTWREHFNDHADVLIREATMRLEGRDSD